MRYKSRGFTLIELLVVIAIIAILAAILFPVFTSAKQRVQMTKCLNNLKHLAMAARMYADDHQGIMPYDWPDKPNWCGCEAASAWKRSIVALYEKYVDLHMPTGYRKACIEYQQHTIW